MLKKIEQTEKYIKFQDKYGTYMIMPVCDTIIRVAYTILDEVKESSELIEKQQGGPENCQWIEEEAGWRLLTKKLNVFIDRENGHVCYMNKNGQVLLKESGREAEKKPIIHYTTNGRPPEIERVKTIDGERNFIKNLQKEEAEQSKKKVELSCYRTFGIWCKYTSNPKQHI